MSTQKMQLVDWLDDLCVRFIINLPQEELENVARICFQVEEAQWFYEDFVRPIDPTLPSLNLKQFCLMIFRHCPLLSAFSDEQHLAAYQEFLGYKTRVPVRGAIMLNWEMDKVLLVKGWKSSASWSFPRGTINKDEPDLDCAIREVYEETGFDISEAGLVSDPDDVKAIDVTMREQHMRLFVFRGVPEDTIFEAKTRKEISKIAWYKLADLPTLRKKVAGQAEGQESHNPNKFYMVAPFLGPLKKWINKQKKMDAQRAMYEEYGDGDIPSEAYVEEQPAVVADPAADLKRLLSIPTAPQPPAQAQPTSSDQQSQSLLAMLRSGQTQGVQQGWPQQSGPKTPFEQLGGFPQQPQSPHAQHVRESAFATSQPPPVFSPPPPQSQPAFYSAPNSGPEPPRQLSANQQHLLQMMQRGLNTQAQSSQQQLPFPGPPQSQQQGQMPSAFEAIGNASTQTQQPGQKNDHLMSLLNAFKSPPQPGQRSALLDAARKAPMPKTPHQDSLLDLLRGARGPTASPAATVPAESAPSAAPRVGIDAEKRSTAAPTARKASAMSMINRSLPKPRQPSAPKMDVDNFPALGSVARPIAKAIAQQVEENKSEPPKPVKILSRPEQTVTTAARMPSRPSSRTVTPTPKTILQRPSSGQRIAEGTAPQVKPAFQPQILKRGEATPPLAGGAPDSPSSADGANTTSSAAQTQSQRNALLSLFAQTQQRSGAASPDAATAGSPDAAAARWGSIGDGPSGASMSGNNSMATSTAKSPETPSEKRGFLMDFLDGVVRGAGK